MGYSDDEPKLSLFVTTFIAVYGLSAFTLSIAAEFKRATVSIFSIPLKFIQTHSFISVSTHFYLFDYLVFIVS
jgi:hypothetical protein